MGQGIFGEGNGIYKVRAVWYIDLNTCFQFLNNITYIFTHFFTDTYLQKTENCCLNTRTKRALIPLFLSLPGSLATCLYNFFYFLFFKKNFLVVYDITSSFLF